MADYDSFIREPYVRHSTFEARMEAMEARMDARVAVCMTRIDALCERMDERDRRWDERHAAFEQRMDDRDKQMAERDRHLASLVEEAQAAAARAEASAGRGDNLKATIVVTSIGSTLAMLAMVLALHASNVSTSQALMQNVHAAFQTGMQMPRGATPPSPAGNQ